MKNRAFASLAVIVLILSIFQVTLTITPVVFSSDSITYKEIWQVVNVTNTHGSMTTSGNINIALNNRTGVNIAWSVNITEYFENFAYWSSLGYATYMDWLNGTSTLPYHWGDVDWYVSEGSLTPITWDEIKYWWDMYRDSGGGVNYSTFMGSTYMADFNFTDPTNDPDIIRYNQTQVGVPWVGNTITVKDLVVPASSTIHLVLKIVITKPGMYTFNVTSPNPLFQISPSYLKVGGAATILVPYEFLKVQDAVDAASSGYTIFVDQGEYDEQIVINKSLTVEGAGDATIIRPSSAAKLNKVFDGLFWYGSPNTKQIASIIVANVPDGNNVTIKNLKVDESPITSKPAGADYVAGIFYRETGGTIDSVEIVGTGPWSSSDRAYGIYLSAATNTVSVRVSGSTITNFDKNGVEAMGDKLTFNIFNNTIIGRGPVADEVQNGINAGRGSVGTVNNNVFRNLAYQPETWWSAAILFYESNGSATNNIITDCQIGVIFQDGSGLAQSNTVDGGSVGLIGLWAQYTKAGVWTVSFIGNNVTGVRDSSGYENAAVGVQSWNEGALISAVISGNRLNASSTDADGIFVGDLPGNDPAGEITVAIINNTVSNWQHGVRIESSVNITASYVNFNNIFGNQLYGLFSNLTETVDARFNWWGNDTGPYNPTFNPLGSGNNVSDNVQFKPWLVQPYPPAVPVSQLYVDPQLIECWTGLNETFTVRVKLDNAKLLYGFQFKLTWNPALINLTSATYTSLWTDTYLWRHEYDNSLGEYQLALSGKGNVSSFNGNATLATLTFTIIYKPLYPETVMANLSLVNTMLTRSQNMTGVELIPHTVRNGTYICNYTLPTLKLGAQEYVVRRVPEKFEVNITVTYVVNLEAFDFTLEYDPNLLTLLHNESDILLRGTSWGISWSNGSVYCYSAGINPRVSGTATLAKLKFKSLGVVWNTVNRSATCALSFSNTNLIGPGNASIVHVVINGTYIYKPVPGDLDMDGTVTIIDLSAAARAFGTSRGEPGWFETADINCDGTINILDIVVIARNFGRTEPEP